MSIAGWKMDHLKMYFLLKMGIFQPAMLVYQRVYLQSYEMDLDQSIPREFVLVTPF